MLDRLLTRREALRSGSGVALIASLAAAGCDRKPKSGVSDPSTEPEAANPGPVHKYDVMTDLDVLFSYYLGLATVGEDIAQWPLVKELLNLSKQLIDATVISEHLNESLSVNNQPAFAHVRKLVDECATLLHVPSPQLFVRADPAINAYVTRLGEPHFLVVTSGLYEAYKNFPEEMRFVIGHEIGHLKCAHIRCHAVGQVLINMIRRSVGSLGISEELIAPGLAGVLLRWFRDSEFSADRAGLICLNGDLKTAQKALLRLLHGTKEDNIDPEQAERDQMDLENQPFVRIMNYLRSAGNTHPFLPERLKGLRQWSLTGAYASLLERLKRVDHAERNSPARTKGTLYLEGIEVKGLPDVSALGVSRTPEPIVKAVYGDAWKQSGGLGKTKDPSMTELGWEFQYLENGRLIVEVADRRTVGDDVLLGAAVTPMPADSRSVECDLRMGIRERSTVAQAPRVTVRYHII